MERGNQILDDAERGGSDFSRPPDQWLLLAGNLPAHIVLILDPAARALDRALAAIVVAAARHLAPSLTPDADAGDVASLKAARPAILKMILDRAPAAGVVGGHAALQVAVENLLDTWQRLAEERTANAERLYYGYPVGKALLHDPLDQILKTLDPPYRQFTAGRSMRDVEHASVLKITDPYGNFLN